MPDGARACPPDRPNALRAARVAHGLPVTVDATRRSRRIAGQRRKRLHAGAPDLSEWSKRGVAVEFSDRLAGVVEVERHAVVSSMLERQILAAAPPQDERLVSSTGAVSAADDLPRRVEAAYIVDGAGIERAELEGAIGARLLGQTALGVQTHRRHDGGRGKHGDRCSAERYERNRADSSLNGGADGEDAGTQPQHSLRFNPNYL